MLYIYICVFSALYVVTNFTRRGNFSNTQPSGAKRPKFHCPRNHTTTWKQIFNPSRSTTNASMSFHVKPSTQPAI